MPESKKDLLKAKRKWKKVVKYLKKLQKVCWSTHSIGTWELIEEAEIKLTELKKRLAGL